VVVEVKGLVVERVSAVLPRLPDAFHGLTVALIADLHAGLRWQGVAAVERLVAQVNELAPDAIVLLGDVIHHPRRIAEFAPVLGGLRARHGVWACLGNHEHGFVWYSRFIGASPHVPREDWRGIYGEVGISVLLNESTPLEQDGGRLWLVGVDDAYSGNDDLPAALRSAQARECLVAITHSPDLMDHRRVSEVDLVLAGHTHGGQVHFPYIGPVVGACRRPRQRAAGFDRSAATPLYVSRGAGEGLPLRWRCPREVTLLTLYGA
jgi:uncharacterized protein